MGTKKSPLQVIAIRNIYTIIFVSLILLFGLGIAHAEPTKTIQHLMAEPATLFDLGLFRLENLLRKTISGTLDVSYDRERNKIQINVVRINRISQGGKGKGREDLWTLISLDINKIRHDLNVNLATGEIDSGYTTLENCFRHAGYTENEGRGNLKDELYDMIEISAKVIVHRDKAAVEAKAPLKGNRIEWVKFN